MRERRVVCYAVPMTEYLYGKHLVAEILRVAPERIETLYLSQSAEKEFKALAGGRVKVEDMPKSSFFRDIEGAVHQGVIARVNVDNLLRDYHGFLKETPVSPATCLILLNEVTDPHNVGAIIRSAAAFGAFGVLLPSHGQALITGAVAKASAGAIFHVPLVAIGNENQAIIDLKKRGFWIYGLAGEATKSLYEEAFTAPTVIVIGSEGEGLRRKTKEHCDIQLSIPMHSATESLNASVAAAVALSHWSKQHPEALRQA